MDKRHNNQDSEATTPDLNKNDLDINDVDNIDLQQEETEAAKDMAQEAENEVEKLQKELDDTKSQLEKEKKEYLFLMAEFDNFRKRTVKEKGEIIKNGASNVLKGLLPIVDDFERSIQAINENSDASSIKEGVTLIYNKFVKYLEQNGVKAIPTEPGADFDTELHEAVTTFPVDDESKKGKVIDTIQKGYMINDKVLRHAKVVVGQ
ncbi:MAG: nucleotide exchange factor GrpE [Muribaculum sp.]|nr:nucleotide exchange factor GrpE [Muribaculum sp.]